MEECYLFLFFCVKNKVMITLVLGFIIFEFRKFDHLYFHNLLRTLSHLLVKIMAPHEKKENGKVKKHNV